MLSIKDVSDAHARMAPYIHHTPLVQSTCLGEMAGCHVFFKCENLQKTGSFKIRGAINRMLSLSPEEQRRGVVCYSSGNHAQAVAYAAKALGISASLFMPETATPAKVAACRSYGGQVTLFGQTGADCRPLAEKASREEGRIYIDPVEDPLIISGQGTTGLEILEDLPHPDVVYIPVGGGGLCSGIATAIKALSPQTKVVGVEPAYYDYMTRSIHAGKITSIRQRPSIADGLAGSAPGPMAFEICSALLDDIFTVSEEEIAQATRLILERTKLLAEPSGATAFAGLLSGRGPQGKNVVCVISGGNANFSVLASLLTQQ